MATCPRPVRGTEAKTPRRRRRTTTRTTMHTFLPCLSTPSNGEPVVAVRVQREPSIDDKKTLVWVADEEPARRLGRGQLISMQNEHGTTGPGLLTAITDLRQHWVTWTVNGGPETCRIRVPIPWTSMTGVEAIAHVRHFHSLPQSPPCHDKARPKAITNNNEYPYDNNLDENERQRLESRLDEITKRTGEWKSGEQRKRRRIARKADEITEPRQNPP